MRLARIIREIVDHVKDRAGTFILTVAELQYMVTSALTVTKAVTRIQTHVLYASGKEWCIMTREIKFRMWNECGEASRMFYSTDEVMECLKQQMFFNDYPDNKRGWDHAGEGCAFEQYTGLKDKNGKEIYEGDLCHTNNETYAIELQETGGSFRAVNINSEEREEDVHFLLNCNHFLEVIGNIHQNPELL